MFDSVWLQLVGVDQWCSEITQLSHQRHGTKCCCVGRWFYLLLGVPNKVTHGCGAWYFGAFFWVHSWLVSVRMYHSFFFAGSYSLLPSTTFGVRCEWLAWLLRWIEEKQQVCAAGRAGCWNPSKAWCQGHPGQVFESEIGQIDTLSRLIWRIQEKPRQTCLHSQLHKTKFCLYSLRLFVSAASPLFPWSWWVPHGQLKRVWNRVPLWRQVPLEGSLPVRRQLLLRSFLCWASGSETSSNTVLLRV